MGADGGGDKPPRPARDVYRKVSRRMWSDAKFMALSGPQPNGQSLLVHLLTGPHTGMIPGLSVAGQAQLAEQLGWDLGSEGLPEGLRQGLPGGLPEGCADGMPDGFRQAFAEVAHQGIAVADWKARLVWLPKAVYHNEPESPNVVRSWRSAWTEIPECSLKHVAWQGLRAFMEARGATFLEAFDEALPEPFTEPLPAPLPPPLGESRTRTGTGVRAVTGPSPSKVLPKKVDGLLLLAPDPSASGSAARTKVSPGELFELGPETDRMTDPVEYWFPIAGDEPPKHSPHGPWRRNAAGAFEWGLRRSQVLKLAELYPGVGEGGEAGVRLEIARCQDWNVENPSRRKTYPRGQGSGVWEHLKRWLGDKHGKGGPGGNGNGTNGHANGVSGKYGVTDAMRLAARGDMGRHPELDARAADIQQRIIDERKRQEAARGN